MTCKYKILEESPVLSDVNESLETTNMISTAVTVQAKQCTGIASLNLSLCSINST